MKTIIIELNGILYEVRADTTLQNLMLTHHFTPINDYRFEEEQICTALDGSEFMHFISVKDLLARVKEGKIYRIIYIGTCNTA